MSPSLYFVVVTPVLFLLIAHWLGDFVLQSDTMAKGKSKSWSILAVHVFVYSLVLTASATGLVVSSYPIHELPWQHSYSLATQLATFAVVNAALHFCVDAVTSRITAYLWAKGNVHGFFVMIGLDQLLHVTCILLTLPILPLWLV